jgi:hypothetical protein
MTNNVKRTPKKIKRNMVGGEAPLQEIQFIEYNFSLFNLDVDFQKEENLKKEKKKQEEMMALNEEIIRQLEIDKLFEENEQIRKRIDEEKRRMEETRKTLNKEEKGTGNLDDQGGQQILEERKKALQEYKIELKKLIGDSSSPHEETIELTERIRELETSINSNIANIERIGHESITRSLKQVNSGDTGEKQRTENYLRSLEGVQEKERTLAEKVNEHTQLVEQEEKRVAKVSLLKQQTESQGELELIERGEQYGILMSQGKDRLEEEDDQEKEKKLKIEKLQEERRKLDEEYRETFIQDAIKKLDGKYENITKNKKCREIFLSIFKKSCEFMETNSKSTSGVKWQIHKQIIDDQIESNRLKQTVSPNFDIFINTLECISIMYDKITEKGISNEEDIFNEIKKSNYGDFLKFLEYKKFKSYTDDCIKNNVEQKIPI